MARVHPLDLFPFLASAQDRLISQVGRMHEADSIVLLVQPDLGQILSSTFIESALLDAGLGYSRRLRLSLEEEVGRPGELKLLFHDEETSSQTDTLPICSFTVAIGLGRKPSVRTGVLDRVAVAAIIAMLLAPAGPRVEQMLPLLLAGNWMRQSLDMTYDPVFTGLRDSLLENRLVTMHSIAEIESVDMLDLPGIQTDLLRELQNEWPRLDLDARAQGLSTLAEPLLSGTAGTARLEELIWHRLLSPASEVDLASQCSQVRRMLKSSEPEQRLLIADALIDGLIRTGRLC